MDKEVVNGHVERPQDEDIQSNVLEIIGSNIQSTYITCPADPAATLGIKLPFLVLIVKNLMKYFTFEIQVLDDKNVRRRFRASNFQAVTRVKPYMCTMPLRMDEGWNQIHSLTWLISPREHMVLIMWRHCKFRYMQTVA
ncbi:hypothetical protein GLYMA_13G188051v4 [Glycine max]|nr:hypothetical protein GLYMA_13G188051v4 [Glycine max]KAH1102238.1 hypothetical protein GYH30_036671 [Glycine max]